MFCFVSSWGFCWIFFLFLLNILVSIIFCFSLSFIFFYNIGISTLFRGDTHSFDQSNASEFHHPFETQSNQLHSRKVHVNKLPFMPSFQPFTSQTNATRNTFNNNLYRNQFSYQPAQYLNAINHDIWLEYSNCRSAHAQAHPRNGFSSKYRKKSPFHLPDEITKYFKDKRHFILNAIFGAIFYTILIFLIYTNYIIWTFQLN